MAKNQRKKKSIDECQFIKKLSMILENKVVQNLRLQKSFCQKKWSPILIFLNEKKRGKIPTILDIKNRLRFWHFLTNHHFKSLKSNFPLTMLILSQKSCILGPAICEIPQPNWYYYRVTVYITGVFTALCTLLGFFHTTFWDKLPQN